MISIPQPISRIVFFGRDFDKQRPPLPATKNNRNKLLLPNRLASFWPGIHCENITNLDADRRIYGYCRPSAPELEAIQALDPILKFAFLAQKLPD
jgi:hypothetical protein